MEQQNNESKKKSVKSRTPAGTLLAIAILLLSVAAVFAAATAWVTVNKRAKSDGVEMTAETSPNLVIAADVDTITNEEILSPDFLEGGSPFTVTFEPLEDTFYKAATHEEESTTGLAYLPNGRDVDTVSGGAKEGKTLSFEKVEDGDTAYYRDFIVYIASAGAELPAQTLRATLTPPEGELSDTAMALSVDFYFTDTMGEEPTDYVGTLNLAGVDCTDPTSELTYLDFGTDLTIPKNEDGYFTVLMRAYFDGALLKDDGTAYFNSATLDTSPVSINVHFSAEE